MDPIPTWVRTLWDTWDLRVLVLLSFTLQIILSLFGSRRKYISSVWISVLVWSAYLIADWVATVALGKLSNAQGNCKKSSVLWAIWAPLLLLHLGGPDSITAYSLQDNQLWMRHLMGLVVHLFVVIYVILLSWKNLWVSYMSFPALVAGIIKYGERTWVLKLVSHDNYKDTIPFFDCQTRLEDEYSVGDHEYVRALIVGHTRLTEFMTYLANEGHYLSVNNFRNIEANNMCDAVEVEMGLMYDLLYTKVPIIYSKGGFTMRCISFGSTVTVLVGLIFQILHLETREEDDREEQKYWREIDITITGVLIVGALALAIYAAIAIFSSNWVMLWLIKHGKKEWVEKLSETFPSLFNKKKNWSKTMGQFDLLGYYLKVRNPDVQSPSRKIIRSLVGRNYEEQWNRYLHTTSYSIQTVGKLGLIYNVISDYWMSSVRLLESLELKEIWEIADGSNPRGSFLLQIKCAHLATEICYHLDMEWGADGHEDPSITGSGYSIDEIKEVSKSLSDYMMYLLIMHPSLLPNVGLRGVLEQELQDPRLLIGDEGEVNAACKRFLKSKYAWSRVAKHLKGKGKRERWELVTLMWLKMLQTATDEATGFGQKDGHFQHLRQGGELLTFIWLSSMVDWGTNEAQLSKVFFILFK